MNIYFHTPILTFRYVPSVFRRIRDFLTDCECGGVGWISLWGFVVVGDTWFVVSWYHAMS